MTDRTPRRRRGGSDDGGETLVELLFTITIMGLTVVAVVGGIATAILLSVTHRKEATAGAAVHTFAEAVQNKAATGYVSCATTSTYGGLYTAPTGFTASVTGVKYWNGTSFASTCGTDQGVQQVAIKVATPDNKVSETLLVIVRKPCRPTDSPC